MSKIEHSGIYVNKASIAVTMPEKLKSGVIKPIKINNDTQDIVGEIISWGSDNLYPQNFYNNKYLKNGAAVGGVNALRNAHYGSGFELFKKHFENNTSILKSESLENHPEIQKFIRQNKMNRLWYEVISDQTLFHIGFVHCAVSVDFKTIVNVRRQKAAWCRFEKQQPNGRIERVWINSDWATADQNYSIPVLCADPLASTEELRERLKSKNVHEFIYPSYYPLIDEAYYPKTDWHAVDRNGWIDVANSVPELKQAIFNNQIHLKYIIYVSETYFENFYGNDWFSEFTPKEREQKRRELTDAVDDHLSGNKAGGRSIVSPIIEENGKFVEGIKVVPIPNNLQDGSYLPDASAANSEILFALGVDPAIIGLGIPGGKNLSGSGSDKREAYTILCANLKPRREITLEIWDLIRDFNNWDPNLIGAFPNMVLTTLDKDHSGQNKIVA